MNEELSVNVGELLIEVLYLRSPTSSFVMGYTVQKLLLFPTLLPPRSTELLFRVSSSAWPGAIMRATPPATKRQSF